MPSSRVARTPTLAGRPAQRRGETTTLERRRVDALCELRGLVQRLLDGARHVVHERLRCRRILLGQLVDELQIDRERDQVLLNALVQVALDPAPVGVRG